jgi:hypothetical protein
MAVTVLHRIFSHIADLHRWGGMIAVGEARSTMKLGRS